MSRDTDWEADLARYPAPRPMLKEQSLWAVWVYRYGRRVDRMPAGLPRKLATIVYWLLFRVVETLTAISLPKTAEIGPGLRIWHFGNIFIHSNARIGAHCTLRQGVTIGNRTEDGPVPVIGWAACASATTARSARCRWCSATSRTAAPPWARQPASSARRCTACLSAPRPL